MPLGTEADRESGGRRSAAARSTEHSVAVAHVPREPAIGAGFGHPWKP